MTRTLPPIYEAIAEAVRISDIPTEARCKVVKELCRTLKKPDARFDPARFSEACWSNEEW
ncbi:MAG: hypothetical protein WC551_13845 [Patescibacteria group bacterium]